MQIAPAIRGQPLLAFVAMMAGWTALRVLALEGGDYTALAAQPAVTESTGPESAVPESAVPEFAGPLAERLALLSACASKETPFVSRSVGTGAVARVRAMMPVPDTVRGSGAVQAPTMEQGAFAQPAGQVPDHDPASGVRAAGVAEAPFYPVGHEARQEQRRWSADGWLLLRSGGHVSLATGSAPATYGASQAGAVLRYRLAPLDPHRPAAFLRTTAALNGSREREAALGLSARPVAGLPVVGAVEVRLSGGFGGTRLRPAAFAVTELPPIELPMGLRAEAYAQAGYVGGNYATSFADGQLRVDRLAGRLGRASLRMGGGSWGGAQKGASRLDFGPTAAIVLQAGQASSLRLAIDWRLRVAGNAEPDSGPAVTLSAGF